MKAVIGDGNENQVRRSRSNSGMGQRRSHCLRAGWSVLAIDATPQAAEVLGRQVPDDAADRLVIRIASAEMVELP